jgi:hypothetical protein
MASRCVPLCYWTVTGVTNGRRDLRTPRTVRAQRRGHCVGSVVHAIEIKRVPGKPERRARDNTELKGGFVPRNSLNSWLYLARPLPICYNLHAFADRTDDGVILVSPLLTGGWKDGTQVAE